MENNICINILFNVTDEEKLEAECSVQFYDFQIVPHVGERFIYYAVRDNNGKYLNKNYVDGAGIKIIDGLVEKVIYEVDERGFYRDQKATLSHTYFILIFVRGDPINDERFFGEKDGG